MTVTAVDPLIELYSNDIADLRGRVDIVNRAVFAREDKLPSEAETRELDVLNEKLINATAQLTRVTEQRSLTEAAEAAVAKTRIAGAAGGGGGADPVMYRSEGAALADFLNRGHDESARYRWARHAEQHRAAQHMGTTAAGTTPVAGGFDGLIVPVATGPVIRLFPEGIPFLDLIGAQDVIGAMRRTRLVDPDFTTAVGPHAGDKEKGEFPSKKWDYVPEELRAGPAIGNYINLSMESETFVPVALDETIAQLRARTEYGLEVRAVAEASKTTNTVALAPDADAVTVLRAINKAKRQVFDATKRPATWMAYGVLADEMLSGLVDLAQRPMFPYLGPSNALGTTDGGFLTNPFGLRSAITPAITDGSILIGNSFGLEAYIKRLPVLQAVEPSVGGRQVGAYALLAFYRPITTEASGTGAAAVAQARNGVVKVG